MTAGQDPANQLFELATTYRLSALFFAALDLDVFSHIPAEGASSAVIAAALQVPDEQLRVLLNPMVGMGILSLQQDGGYLIAPAYAALLRRGPGYRGDQFLRHKEAAADWLQLASIVRGTDAGPAYYPSMLQSDSVRPYLSSIQITNQPHAEAMFSRLRAVIPRLQRVLDVGGGHGYYAERLLELNPTVTVTVLDVAQSLAYCQQRLAGNPHRQRLELVEGDARSLDFNGGFDLVMINDLLHYFSPSEKANVAARAARALAPNGILAVMKLRLEADGVRPASSALFSLMVMVNTHTGRLETDVEAQALLRAAGLHNVRVIQLHEERSLVLGER